MGPVRQEKKIVDRKKSKKSKSKKKTRLGEPRAAEREEGRSSGVKAEVV
jgi:hypothetical protein